MSETATSSKPAADDSQARRCTRCKKSKFYGEFSVRKATGRLHSWCKACCCADVQERKRQALLQRGIKLRHTKRMPAVRTSRPDLKPCPFCAREAALITRTSKNWDGKAYQTYQIQCSGCISSSAPRRDLTEAVTLWESRPPRSLKLDNPI